MSTKLLVLAFLFLPLPGAAQASQFELHILGIAEAKGLLQVALYAAEEDYRKKPLRIASIPVKGDSCVWMVPSLPFGEYALTVFHDKNSNGKLDTNLIGVPKEKYGFSNGARGIFGPAKWKEARFVVNRASVVEKIELK